MKFQATFLCFLVLIPIMSNAQGESYTIAFGSCNNQDKEQKLWDDIFNEDPDLFIWLGDNIYGDSKSYETLTKKYNQQNTQLAYSKLKDCCKITGIWDDHDYGLNDGGKEFSAKQISQKAFCNFMDLGSDDIRRSRLGIYHSETIIFNDLSIKLLLLDTRYFRDELIKSMGACQPNETGTILGTAQWAWLESELTDSKADIHIIASSIQFLAAEHRFEKWANFPTDRTRMLDLLSKNKMTNVLFLSGDRHTGEISYLEADDMSVYDITSSSMTHGIKPREEPNQYRKGNIVFTENYGVLNISADSIRVSLKSDGAKIQESLVIKP